MVAFCGYHSWHDWCPSAHLGATTALDGYLLPGFNTKGVPRELTGLMHPFHFNKLDEIETIVAEHGEGLAAIMMEPVRSTEPDPAFIGGIRAQTVWQYRARRPHLLSAAPLLSRRGLGRGHVSGPASFAHYA
jgi:glutamate-1-semialdehyde aminotransferase